MTFSECQIMYVKVNYENIITIGFDNKNLYAVYPIHTSPEYPSGDRRPAIDRLYFENGETTIEGHTSRKIHILTES